VKLGARALGTASEAMTAEQLEVALLERARPRRAFRRLRDAEVATLLGG
jgi:hypothetical protein